MFSTSKNHGFIVVGLFLLFNLIPINAQQADDDQPWSVGADLMTRFYWRGANQTVSPAFQPYIEYGVGAFTFGTWSSYSFSKEPFQEIDVYASYQIKNVRLTVYDYFSPIDSMDVSHHYFDWDKKTTAHAVELILEVWDAFDTGFALEAGLFIYGDDKDEDGNNLYSAYFEPQYNFSKGEMDVKLFAGFSPGNSMYSDDLEFVNIGLSATRELHIYDNITLPFTAMFAINPATESVFMVAGISF
ncbi:hypothetical protein [Carboxylicivirga sp. N1Y90]|uniref:hypothetical protein n=1 Tax=Carboxylicivirga fragile TaxID=3417571 RepID=UPI003D35661A|nr:hypothetical protein [Marinilabiliaceae bacterium N1Y90]